MGHPEHQASRHPGHDQEQPGRQQDALQILRALQLEIGNADQDRHQDQPSQRQQVDARRHRHPEGRSKQEVPLPGLPGGMVAIRQADQGGLLGARAPRHTGPGT